MYLLIYAFRCKEKASKARLQLMSVGGEDVSRCCRAVLAALLWHTQHLRDDVHRFLSENGAACVKDGVVQAFNAAEGLRLHLVCCKT